MSTNISITGLEQLQKRLQEAAEANRRAHIEEEARDVRLQVFASTPTSLVNEPVRPIRSLLKGAGPTAQREQQQQLRFNANGVLGWMSMEGDRTLDSAGVVHVVSGDGGSAVELPIYLEEHPYQDNPYTPLLGRYLKSVIWDDTTPAGPGWTEWGRYEPGKYNRRFRYFSQIQVVVPKYTQAQTFDCITLPADTTSGLVAVRNGVRNRVNWCKLVMNSSIDWTQTRIEDRVYDDDAPPEDGTDLSGMRICIIWSNVPYSPVYDSTELENTYYYPDRLVRFSHTAATDVTDNVSPSFWTAYDTFRPHVRDATAAGYDVIPSEVMLGDHISPFTLDGIDFDGEFYDTSVDPAGVKINQPQFEYPDWDYLFTQCVEFYGTPGYLWLDDGDEAYAWFTGGAYQQYAYSSVSAFANEFVLDALLGTFPFEYDDVTTGLSKVDYYALFDYFPAGYCLEALYKQAPSTEAGYTGPDIAFNSGLPSFTEERYADVDENYGENAGWGGGLFTMAYPTIKTNPYLKTYNFVPPEDRLPAAEIREQSHHILYTNVFNNEAQVISKLASLGVNLPPLP